MTQQTGSHIVIAGVGNTGSHLIPHLARMREIGRITLIDPDIYTKENAIVQNFDRMEDIGAAKVIVQADKLRRIRECTGLSPLDIVTFQERVEDVPRGLLACNLIVSCLDSLAARQHVNEIAWRMNVPWTDCGVQGSLSLARVNSYRPATQAHCLECSWGIEEYQTLQQDYVCGAGSSAAHPTMSSSALGAFAASLLAIEITKLLSEDPAHTLVDRQIVVDTLHHTLDVSTYQWNPNCRFDHRTWQVEPWICPPAITTLGAALNIAGSLQVDGHRFAHKLICPSCDSVQTSLKLNRPAARCAKCNSRMIAPGFELFDRIDSERARGYEELTLAQLGLRVGDIVTDAYKNHRCITEAA